MIKLKKKYLAFTLVELMVVITIISILSGVAIMGLNSVRQKAQDTSHLATIRDLQISLEAFKSVNGSYPDTMALLAPTFINKIPTDTAYSYTISSDKKTYCVYLRNVVSKPQSQPELYFSGCPNSWTACKGKDVSALSTCQAQDSGDVSGGSGDGGGGDGGGN